MLRRHLTDSDSQFPVPRPGPNRGEKKLQVSVRAAVLFAERILTTIDVLPVSASFVVHTHNRPINGPGPNDQRSVPQLAEPSPDLANALPALRQRTFQTCARGGAEACSAPSRWRDPGSHGPGFSPRAAHWKPARRFVTIFATPGVSGWPPQRFKLGKGPAL